MKKWRIQRLKINGFKIFSAFEESYNSALTVYDGPNGFGKTSLFDAKQLLFCGQIPRITARATALKLGNKHFDSNLYRNHSSNGDVVIIAELKKGSESLCIMRKASSDAIRGGSNKPSDFTLFKLYQLHSFEDEASAELIADEAKFWAENLGDKFLKNFSVLNYLQQDSKSIVIPDKCADDKSRTNQIEHLINLDALKARQNNIQQLKVECGRSLISANTEKSNLKETLDTLFNQITAEGKEVEYLKISTSELVPPWDLESPLKHDNLDDFPLLLSQLALLESIVTFPSEVEKRLNNKQKLSFVQRDEFALAVRLTPYFGELDSLRDKRKQLLANERLITTLSLEPSKITEEHLPDLASYLGEEKRDFNDLIELKKKLLNDQSQTSSTLTQLLQVREKLMKLSSENGVDCPLCGHDYGERKLLLESVEARAGQIKDKLDKQGLDLTACYKKINGILQPIHKKQAQEFAKLKERYNEPLLLELESCLHQQKRLDAICKRLKAMGIDLPSEYAASKESKNQQVEVVREKVIKSLEPEDALITEEAMRLFANSFTEVSELKALSQSHVQDKRRYLKFFYNSLISKTLKDTKQKFVVAAKKVEVVLELEERLKAIDKALNKAQNDYIGQTIGQMESLFHIYSGRLLQNYQCGLGVFIDMPGGTRKNTMMNFITARGQDHDAVLSMSSGQISALSLALFLALNKKYAQTAFVFIDDPTQCMDEINIASLSDLLRVELRDRQVVISTHEQDISDYLCYRYGKAGLTRKQVNLQKRLKAQATTVNADKL